MNDREFDNYDEFFTPDVQSVKLENGVTRTQSGFLSGTSRHHGLNPVSRPDRGRWVQSQNFRHLSKPKPVYSGTKTYFTFIFIYWPLNGTKTDVVSYDTQNKDKETCRLAEIGIQADVRNGISSRSKHLIKTNKPKLNLSRRIFFCCVH